MNTDKAHLESPQPARTQFWPLEIRLGTFEQVMAMRSNAEWLDSAINASGKALFMEYLRISSRPCMSDCWLWVVLFTEKWIRRDKLELLLILMWRMRNGMKTGFFFFRFLHHLKDEFTQKRGNSVIISSTTCWWKVSLSWKHSWNLTERRFCCLLLNNWRRELFELPKETRKNSKTAPYSFSGLVSGSLDIPNWFWKDKNDTYAEVFHLFRIQKRGINNVFHIYLGSWGLGRLWWAIWSHLMFSFSVVFYVLRKVLTYF